MNTKKADPQTNADAAAAHDAAQPDPRKPGRPLRNDVAATGHVHIRTTLSRKAAWVRAAKPRKLAEWMTENLDRAAKYEPHQDFPTNF